MGLMNWFRKIAGAADDAAARQTPPGGAEIADAEVAGLNFMTAIDAHMKWKTRLENYINGTSDEDLRVEVVSCDDKCPLGQWIYGRGGESYGGFHAFAEMKSMHAHFHRCAGEVLATALQGRKDEALRMLDQGEYVRASERVKILLAKLYVQLAER